MNKNVILGLVIVVAVVGAMLIIINISYDRKEIGLRKQINAEQVVYEQNFDMVTNTISQEVQVAERNVEVNKEAFKEIYPDLIEGRYSKDDGSLMKWITEQNPQWDMQAITALYNAVIRTIETQRQGLFNQSKKLLDLVQTREALIEDPIGSLFINNQEKIEIKLVSSTRTKQALETGVDDDIELFKKKTE